MAEQNLAWWMRRRAALYVAYTSPTREVEFEGRKEQARSLAEIEKQIRMCDQVITGLEGTAGPIKNTEVFMRDV